MIMASIHILSGPVHSGKTSRLNKWITQQHNVSGVLAPVINNKRYLKDLSSGEQRCLEVDNPESGDTVLIGRYLFSVKVFEWAVQVIENAIHLKPEWLIIDEVGPLELDNKGLAPAIESVLGADTNSKIILVVRQNLLQAVINHYQLESNILTELKF